jgi:enoyl-CoA hydratase
LALVRLVLLDRPTTGVAVVTLNRPEKYNALIPELLAQLGEQLTALASDESCRAIVLTGAGKAFCAGLDLGAVAVGARFGPAGLAPLTSAPQPVIGAINGVAVTGGLELALACDFRIGSTAARFADTHSRVGIVPGWGLTARLPQAVGQAWARQMSFTGDFVDAATALRIGLINEVVDPDSLLDRAVALAAAVATTDAETLRTIRSIYADGRDGTGADALARETSYTSSGGLAMADPDAFAARAGAVFARGKAQQ